MQTRNFSTAFTTACYVSLTWFRSNSVHALPTIFP